MEEFTFLHVTIPSRVVPAADLSQMEILIFMRVRFENHAYQCFKL
jgi:hypothetical protein